MVSQAVGFQSAPAHRDQAVVAAVWEEDDAFVARTQAVESRSVVVKRSRGPILPSEQRLARLPENSLEPSVEDYTSELEIEDPPIEDVEAAIDQEFERRQNQPEPSDQDLFGETLEDGNTEFEEQSSDDMFEEEPNHDIPEVAQADPFDEPAAEITTELDLEEDLEPRIQEEPERDLEDNQIERDLDDLFDETLDRDDSLDSNDISDLFDDPIMDEESEAEQGDDSMFFEQENEDTPNLELESQGGGIEELDTELSDQETEDTRMEREANEKNCQEEIEKLRASTINNIDLSIRLEGVAGQDFPYECILDDGEHKGRCWPEITYNWKASALCHKPLYFEQVHLERYGHSWGPYVQPIMSGVHFFGTIPILPYKMGIRTPTECVYTLGYYRPGSCAPYLVDPIPFTWRAALFQAGTATGLSFIVP